MSLITAYRRRDGAKVRIPEVWLEHKVLGKPYRKTKPTNQSPAATGGGAEKKKEN